MHIWLNDANPLEIESHPKRNVRLTVTTRSYAIFKRTAGNAHTVARTNKETTTIKLNVNAKNISEKIISHKTYIQ